MNLPGNAASHRSFHRCGIKAITLLLIFGFAHSPVQADGPQKSAAPSHAEIVRRTIDEQLLPPLSEFVSKAEALATVVSKHCLSRDDKAAVAIASAFADAVSAWAAVAVDRIGPARKKDRATRISFWPDPRGVVRRQVRSKLATSDPSLTDPEQVAKQSVALQGLPALELLLEPASHDEEEARHVYRCAAASAIAANVDRQAKDMLDRWQGPDGWRQTMLKTGAGNKLYKNDGEAAAEVVKSYLAAVQVARENIVLPWLDAIENKKKWAGLPFEKSGNSSKYLESTIRSLEQMHKSIGLDDFAQRLADKGEDDDWIVSWLNTAFTLMKRNAGALQLPADAAKEATPDLRPLKLLKFYTNGLRQIVGRKLAKEAGIFLGFNDLDGD